MSNDGVQESGLVASGTTRMGQDEVWWNSPAEVQRMALGSPVWSGRTGVRGWSAVETHGQWVGLRLRRTSASGKLVREHFSPRVADFV